MSFQLSSCEVNLLVAIEPAVFGLGKEDSVYYGMLYDLGVCCFLLIFGIFFHFKVSFVISQANVLMVLTSDSFTFNFDVMKGEWVHRNNPLPDGF